MDYAWLTELNEHGVGADPAFGDRRASGRATLDHSRQ